MTEESVNLKQIDRLVGTVPDGIEEKSRRRLDGYAAVARRCEERIRKIQEDPNIPPEYKQTYINSVMAESQAKGNAPR